MRRCVLPAGYRPLEPITTPSPAVYPSKLFAARSFPPSFLLRLPPHPDPSRPTPSPDMLFLPPSSLAHLHVCAMIRSRLVARPPPIRRGRRFRKGVAVGC